MISGSSLARTAAERLELDAGRWTDGQAAHGDGHGGDAVVGDVAGLAAVAVGADEQCVVDALVEHGRGVRPAGRRDGGQGGDRASLDGSTDRGRIRVEDGAGWFDGCRGGGHVVQHRDLDWAFPWLSVRDRVPIVHGGGVCGRWAGTMVSWSPTPSPCRPSPMRCATSRSPVSSTARRTSASRGVERCPPMPGCVWFHAVTSGRCELVVDDDRLQLQSGDLALVPHGAGHRIEAGGPSEHPLIPDLPHQEQSDNYAVLHYGGDGPLTRVGLRRTASGAPQRPPPAGRPPARGPRPHRSPHGARRDARPAGRGGARPRGGKRGGDQPTCATSSSSRPSATG